MIYTMSFLAIASTLLLTQESGTAAANPEWKVHKIAVGGEGGWDYLTVDSDTRRLYVSRGNRVVVVDLDKETVVGELPETPGIHGVAIVPERNRFYGDCVRHENVECHWQDRGTWGS